MAQPGDSFMAFPFADETGAKYTLSGKHRLTLVHFWATWCVPCLAELPQLAAIAEKYKTQSFALYPISLDGKGGKAKKFLADKHIGLVTYYDAGSSTFRGLKLKGLPTTIFIDETGDEIARAEGPLDWQSPEVIAFIDSVFK